MSLAKITNIIPKQNFEIVLAQIGAIIKLELDNQKTLQGLIEPINVFNSRVTPFTPAEDLMFNVSVASSDNENFSINTANGSTMYNIDIHCRGVANQHRLGDLESSLILNKYVGMVEYIFLSSHYINLGLSPGIIRVIRLNNVQFFDPDERDSSNTRIARLSLRVDLLKSTEMYQGVQLVGSDTVFNLCETDLGYTYSYNN